MDYKQLSGYISMKAAIGKKNEHKTLSWLQFLGSSNKNNPKVLDQQQVLLTSGYPRNGQGKTWTSAIQNPEHNSILLQGVVNHQEKAGIRLAAVHLSKENTKTQNPSPKWHDKTNNVYFKQEFQITNKPAEENNDNLPFLVENGQDILLEIVKTPYSIKTTLYSSAANDPKNYKEVGVVVYNIDELGAWAPFPNFFNLDWYQIGGGQNPSATTQGTNTNQQQNPEKPAIALKAFAVFEGPEYTQGSYAQNRKDIAEAFINAYIKR